MISRLPGESLKQLIYFFKLLPFVDLGIKTLIKMHVSQNIL